TSVAEDAVSRGASGARSAGRSGRTAGGHATGRATGQGEGMTGGTTSLTSTTSQSRCRAVGPIECTRPRAAATPARSPAISVVSANHQSMGALLTRWDAIATVRTCSSRLRLRRLRRPRRLVDQAAEPGKLLGREAIALHQGQDQGRGLAVAELRRGVL